VAVGVGLLLGLVVFKSDSNTAGGGCTPEAAARNFVNAVVANNCDGIYNSFSTGFKSRIEASAKGSGFTGDVKAEVCKGIVGNNSKGRIDSYKTTTQT